MKTRQIQQVKRIISSSRTIISMLSLSMLILGCSDKGSKTAPKKSDVEAAVKAAIPAFLVLTDFEVEPISTGLETTKVNFKATVSPEEDLFFVDSTLEGQPTIRLLKQVQTQKTKAVLYGSVSATRTMDNWKLADPEITDGMGQFGLPRGSFDGSALIDGSEEAIAEIQKRAQKEKEEERERQKAIREVAEAREAFKEDIRREEEAKKKRLTDATAVGQKYEGFIIYDEMRQRMELVFTEQKGFLIRAEARNPDVPADTQKFSGELVFDPKPEGNRNDGKSFSIVMSPDGEQQPKGDRWEFYNRNGVLKLNPSQEGLEGEAYMGFRYQIKLQKK